MLCVTLASVADRSRASSCIQEASATVLPGARTARMLPKHVRVADLPLKFVMDLAREVDPSSELAPCWPSLSAHEPCGRARIHCEWAGLTAATIYLSGLTALQLEQFACIAKQQWELKAAEETAQLENRKGKNKRLGIHGYHMHGNAILEFRMLG